MAKRRKDRKSIPTACQEDNGTHGLPSKEGQNQLGTGKNDVSNHNAPFLNHHFQPVNQWPYTHQSDVEQSSFIPKSFIQWQQSQHQQPNPTIHQAQYSQTVWMGQRPGFNFSPAGSNDITWQGPVMTSAGASTRNQPLPSSFSYPPGYLYPGSPGPWNPSSWWGQPQQSVHPCSYTFPGAFGYFHSPLPSMPGCSTAALDPVLQRGTIRPPAKLSQNHQQLWEAQSAENVQLWNVVAQLQSELADYKNRLTKLESDILPLKPAVEEPANHCTLAVSMGQKSKKGRPKRSIASNNILPSSVDSQPRDRGHQKAVCKELQLHQEGQLIEDKAAIHHENDRRPDIAFPNCKGNAEVSGSNPSFQDIPVVEMSEASYKTFTESKPDENKFKRIESKSASPAYVGMSSNGNFVWPANIFSKDLGRESLYNDANLSGLGRKPVNGWTSADEEDALLGHENAAKVPGKDEDEEMRGDESSGAEDTP